MAFKVKFSPTTSDFTIKSSAAATGVSSLSDVDTTGPTGTADGATLIYDTATGTYKSAKIFKDLGNDEYELKGGGF